jgi:ankyrin repeat protein
MSRQQLPTDPNAPLFAAAIAGDVARIKAALAHGADINAHNEQDSRFTALMYAIMNGRQDAISVLLENGANSVTANSYNDTPLHFAARHSNLSVARILLDRGADINALNVYGSTPLHFVAKKGQLLAVRMLLDRGANPNILGHQGNTALHLAAIGGHQSLIKLLIECGADINSKNVCHHVGPRMSL